MKQFLLLQDTIMKMQLAFAIDLEDYLALVSFNEELLETTAHAHMIDHDL